MLDRSHADAPEMPDRREALRLGAAVVAAPFLAGLPTGALAAEPAPLPGIAEPFTTRAWGATSTTSPIAPLTIPRRALRPHDVLLDVLYCGICHSDIHTVRGDWGTPRSPCVPGHEVVGRVKAVGSAVTRFRVGDVGGVGCMVDSCGDCDACKGDREQNCARGATWTYEAEDRVSGGHTYGGYSDAMVVAEGFVIRIPPGANLAATAPLLCAGITTFSPMQHWMLGAGQRVGVIGLGGLGHVAVKLAAARGAEVTVFTTTPAKLADATRLGARDAVLSTDAAAMQRLARRFDLLISTVPKAYPMAPFVELLSLDGTLVNVGALDFLQGVHGAMLAHGRRRVAGSLIGGIAETQQVIDYCAARGIVADVELVRPDQIEQAYARVIGKDVRYRFVVDVAGAKQRG